MSETMGLPGWSGWTPSEAEFILKKTRVSPWGSSLGERDWHKAAAIVQLLSGGHLGFWVPRLNCSSVVPGYCELCSKNQLSSKVLPLFIYPDSDSKSGTMLKVGTTRYSGLLLWQVAVPFACYLSGTFVFAKLWGPDQSPFKSAEKLSMT